MDLKDTLTKTKKGKDFMKKSNITLILSTALFALPMATVHADNAPPINGDGKYWTFLQEINKDGPAEQKQAKSLMSVMQAATMLQEDFKKQCQKSSSPKANGPMCKDALLLVLKGLIAQQKLLKDLTAEGEKKMTIALEKAKKL